ncbi:MAG: PDZ domain-containing protein [Planctomycetes bacterium]|nr:PDZ domain-containing protein [Planctomycetota bacterium]
MVKSLFVMLSLLPFLMYCQQPGSSSGSDFGKKVKESKEMVFPALVFIKVAALDYRSGEETRQVGFGSGTIISPDGLVLTNHHVAGEGVRILCMLSTGEEIPAELIATDAINDLAFIQLDLKKRKTSDLLPYAKLGDSNKVQVGDHVLAMGAPLTLSRTVTLGIVSNTERFLGAMSGIKGESVGFYSNWIQHDAAIAPGNSGGPLVNLNGEIVGINTRGGQAGLSFAVPSNVAKEIMPGLLAKKTIPRAFIGFNIQKVIKSISEKGAIISHVYRETPAFTAGIKAGDILTAVDGRSINITVDEHISPTLNFLANLTPETDHEFVVLRNNKELTLKFKVQIQEEQIGKEREFKAFGMTAREIGSNYVLAGWLQKKEGVLVTSIKPNSPFTTARPPISVSDIILTVDGKHIDNFETFEKIYKELEEKNENVLFEYLHQFGKYVTVLKPLTKDDLKREVKSVAISRGWLGVVVQIISPELSRALNLKSKKISGLRVSRVYKGSPAEQASIQVGDIIAEFDGSKISGKTETDINTFSEQIRSKSIGAAIPVKVYRNGKKQTLNVTIAKEPATFDEVDTFKEENYGFTARELTFFDRVAMNLKDEEKGVYITNVKNGGWAQFSGLRTGSTVMKVNGRDINDLNDIYNVMKEIVQKKEKNTIFFVRLGEGVTMFVDVETDWEK